MSRPGKPASELVVCRVCMSHGKQLVPFARYDADRKAYRLADAISAVGAVQVENGDGLPQYCCVRCLREIESAFKVQRMCQESDWKLREMYPQREPAKRKVPAEVRPVVEVMKEELVFKEEYEESRLQETVAGVVAIKQEVEELPQSLDGAEHAVSIKEEIDEVMEVAESDEAIEKQCQSDGDVTREAKNMLWLLAILSHGPEPFKCHMCPFVSATSTQLRAHVQKHSVSNGTYKCFVCGTCYNTPANLKKHTATHPYKLPQKCPYCPRVFNVKKWLTHHINKHRQHGELGNQGIKT
ncbi:hypothetical protein quinque_015247 [Culex quinquefasciatus]